MLSENPIDTKIRAFVSGYITILEENPEIPAFILHEINRNPERILKGIGKAGLPKENIMRMFQVEMDKGNIRKMKPEALMVNILALCIFPFAGRNIIQGILFGGKTDEYCDFLERRKTEVADFILSAIMHYPQNHK